MSRKPTSKLVLNQATTNVLRDSPGRGAAARTVVRAIKADLQDGRTL